MTLILLLAIASMRSFCKASGLPARASDQTGRQTCMSLLHQLQVPWKQFP
jgi:hypothetical protein